MHIFHKWENLGKQWLHDAGQFSFVGSSDNGVYKTTYQVRRCSQCGRYQYKGSLFWLDCEISGRNGQHELCEMGFRKGKGLPGDISPTYRGKVVLDPKDE